MALVTILAAIGALSLGGDRATAQTRPWCLFETAGDGGGAINCGFHTFEQCQASRAGGSSHCGQNPAFVGSPLSSEGKSQSTRERRR
jgi:hypothetical protein